MISTKINNTFLFHPYKLLFITIFFLTACGGGGGNGDDDRDNTNPNNIPPEISLIGDEALFIKVNGTYNDLGASAKDAEDGDISAQVVVDGVVDPTTAGIYTLEYSVQDSDGESSATLERIVNVVGEFVFSADTTLAPEFISVPDLVSGEPKPVARVSFGDVEADFIEGELLVSSDDFNAVMDLANRWGGSILRTVTLDDADDIHTVLIDPSGVDTSKVDDYLQSMDIIVGGEMDFSNTEGLELMAVSFKEMAETGITVAANFLMESTGISDGSTTEESTGDVDYSSNAFTWPYMNLGSAQDTGIAAAWQLLEFIGSNRTQEILIVDGGFIQSEDLPAGSTILGSSWSVPNPSDCSSGDPCPWHGTNVSHVAAAIPDNGLGIAGSAGTHARLKLLQLWPLSAEGMANLIVEALEAPLNGPPAVINVSSSVRVPPVLNVFVNGTLDPLMDFLHRRDVLVVASAGNKGINVDERFVGPVFGIRYPWEESSIIPCETSTVVCVGGLQWDSIVKHEASNYGSDAEADSVDIYTSYETWVPEYTDAGIYQNNAIKRGGTSYSAPLVSGVVALMKSANPGISARSVVNCLLTTAHTFGRTHPYGGNQRRLNAFEAVNCAAGRVDYPLLELQQPSDGLSVLGREVINFEAISFGSDGRAPTIQWASNLDGNIITNGSGAISSINFLSPGVHTLTAQVTDDDGSIRSESVQVTVLNNPPTVDIISIAEGASYFEGNAIPLVANSNDIDVQGKLEDNQITWAIVGNSFTAAGHSTEIPVGVLPIGDYTVTVTADDGNDSATDSVNFSVGPCIGNCPSINIVSPRTSVIRSYNNQDYNFVVRDGVLNVEIPFEGFATDTEDGNISTNIFWRSRSSNGGVSVICAPIRNDDPLSPIDINISCNVFTAFFPSDFDPITYVITATITDSDGNTVSDTITLTVVTDLI